MLILVRHGESSGNAAGLLLGRLDATLTERGLDQVRSLVPFVAGADRLVTSPLVRATMTAAALGLGTEAEIDDRWIEVDYGEYDGRALTTVPDDVWLAWREDPTFRPPGGESLAAVGERVRSACEELLAEGGPARTGDVVVVSHVSPIKAAVCWALDLPDEGAWQFHLGTASITRIGWGPSGPVLHSFNETPWRAPVPSSPVPPSREPSGGS